MGQIYIISDLHFGHKAIALMRGFKDTISHDKTIIENWNNVITKRDTIWILGDITMEKATYSEYLTKLNGIKKVVGGNHDQPQHARKMLEYVNGLCGVYKYKKAWLTHLPIHPTELKNNEINIHGHVHEYTINDGRYINVCCDVVNFTPQPIKNYLEIH